MSMWAAVLCLLSHPTKFCFCFNDNHILHMNNNERKGDTFFKHFLPFENADKNSKNFEKLLIG